jgi:hypothetical protein
MVGSRNLLPRVAVSAALALGLGAAAAPAALAGNQQATTPYGTFECSDGSTHEIFGMPSPRFPIQVGFIGGKGVVARWFESEFNVTLLALYDANTEEELEIPNDVTAAEGQFAGPANMSRRVSQPNLAGLVTCTKIEENLTYTMPLDQEAVDMFGLDDSYIDTEVMIEEDSKLTVYINPKQFAAR